MKRENEIFKTPKAFIAAVELDWPGQLRTPAHEGTAPIRLTPTAATAAIADLLETHNRDPAAHSRG